MMKRWIFLLAGIVAIALVVGCSKKTNGSGNQSQMGTVDSAAGVHWTVPEHWSVGSKQPMRIATYVPPSPKQGVDAGDCGVFFFGSGQGGTVQDNLSRWISQFKNGGDHQFSSRDVNGLKLTTIQIRGTYLAPSGPMMASTGEKPDYRLLGAIVEAPEGMLFLKFVGPAMTVDSSEAGFNQLVASLTKDQAASGSSLSSEK